MTDDEISRTIDRIRAHWRWNELRTTPTRKLFDPEDPNLGLLKFPRQGGFTVGNLVEFLAAFQAGGATKKGAILRRALVETIERIRQELGQPESLALPVEREPTLLAPEEEALRRLRHHKFNPFISDRVTDPFNVGSSFLDIEDVNEDAFRTVSREIELVTSMGQCRGILVLGEAGTGKTHLIARIRAKLASKVRMLFVPRPTNAESVMSSTWTKILESLNQPLHPVESPETSQADKLLRTAFTALVRQHAKDDLGIGFKTRDDINRCCLKIEAGSATAEEVEKYGIRNRLLEAFRHRHGTVGQHGNALLAALLNYVVYRARDRRVRVIEYLRNFEVDDDTCNALGVRPWTLVSDASSNADASSAREEWALDCIRVISKLATHDKPLVLAFDQVEGLRNKLELTRAWGDTIREIMDQGSNIVVISCVFPSLWEEWFTRPRDGYAPLEDSVQHRMAASTVTLRPFSPVQAIELAQRRLSVLDARVRRPTPLFPFTAPELEELYRSQPRRAIRLFIQRCSELFMARVFGASNAAEATSPTEVLLQFIEKCQATERQSADPEWIGVIGEFVLALAQTSPRPRLSYRTRVLPEHLVYAFPGSPNAIVLGVLNARGMSFTARMRNWNRLREQYPNFRFLLTRSASSPSPTSASMGGQLVREMGADFEVVTEAAQRSLFAWHDAVVAIEEGELWAGDVALSFPDLVAAWDFAPSAEIASGFRSLDQVIKQVRVPPGLPPAVAPQPPPAAPPEQILSPSLSVPFEPSASPPNWPDGKSPLTSATVPVTDGQLARESSPSHGPTQPALDQSRHGQEIRPDSEDPLPPVEAPRSAAFQQSPNSRPPTRQIHAARSPRITDWRTLAARPRPEYSSSPEEHGPLFESMARFVRDYGLELASKAPEMVVAPHLITLLYELRPGSSVDKVTKWQKELQLYVRRSARIYHHVARGAIAFEIVRSMRESWTFSHAVSAVKSSSLAQSPLSAPLGITSLGEVRVWDILDGGPGMLVAGSSGSGKSNFLASLALSLMLEHTSDQLQFTLCDVKGVDFNLLALAPDFIAAHENEPEDIADCLERLCEDMQTRLSALRASGLRRWQDFDAQSRPSPYMLVVIDEFADLADSDAGAKCTGHLKQLAQKGRAAGISVVVCTQYPRADILPSPISANLNTRVAFRLQSEVQSRVVLEKGGAEELQGRGDCLVRFADGKVERLLVPYIDAEAEVQLRRLLVSDRS